MAESDPSKTKQPTQTDILRAAAAIPESVSGVYFLIEAGEIVYVGQSIHVLRRVESHLRSKRFDSFSVLPTPAENLDQIEQKYIDELQPRYNHPYQAEKSPQGAQKRILTDARQPGRVRHCRGCDRLFTAKSQLQRFCEPSCRQAYRGALTEKRRADGNEQSCRYCDSTFQPLGLESEWLLVRKEARNGK